MKITVSVPLPPNELSPNGRAHWAAAHREKRRQKLSAWAQATEAVGGAPPRWEHARVTTTYYVRDKRGLKRDEDNALASLKAAFDGIAEAGVVANDRGLHHDERIRFEIDSENPRVEIVVEPVE